ncbi:MAG: hypothetical protein Q9M97_08965 [Candidatus Gracilibacteria bacterium]|nr:hypothetical protein [Candidatus Gracilibacteria bacterium]
MVSFDRIQQLFLEVFGLKISQTTLSKFNKIGFDKLENFEKEITESLLKKKYFMLMRAEFVLNEN